jgi:hypothetical protein
MPKRLKFNKRLGELVGCSTLAGIHTSKLIVPALDPVEGEEILSSLDKLLIVHTPISLSMNFLPHLLCSFLLRSVMYILQKRKIYKDIN